MFFRAYRFLRQGPEKHDMRFLNNTLNRPPKEFANNENMPILSG